MTGALKPGGIQQVIPVMQGRELGGGRVLCVALERYVDGAFAEFWVYPPASPEPPTFPMLGVKVTDDQGTGYRAPSGGGTGVGPDGRWRLGHIIKPAIPDDAGWLELTVRLGRLREDAANTPAGSGSPFDFDEADDPAVFRIPLNTR